VIWTVPAILTAQPGLVGRALGLGGPAHYPVCDTTIRKRNPFRRNCVRYDWGLGIFETIAALDKSNKPLLPRSVRRAVDAMHAMSGTPGARPNWIDRSRIGRLWNVASIGKRR
jgi:hypothetical protein